LVTATLQKKGLLYHLFHIMDLIIREIGDKSNAGLF
jgi:hypothetical protein